MRTTRRLVITLLDALDQRPLAGDLAEEWRDGKSPLWFWWQASCAIASGIFGQIRRHPVLTTRAVLLVWAMATALTWTFAAADLNRALLDTFAAQPLLRGHVPALAWIGSSFVGLVLIGWVMARFHSETHVAATIIVVLLSLPAAAADPELHRLWGNMSEARFLPYLIVHVIGHVTTRVALVIGGVVLPLRARLTG